LQDFFAADFISIGAFCRSITAHGSRRSTVPTALNFFESLNCKCGAELLRQIILLNTSETFCHMLKLFHPLIFSIIGSHNSFFAESFLNACWPFTRILSEALESIKGVQGSRLSFLQTACSLIIRISFEPLETLSTLILEHFLFIQDQIRKISRYAAIDTQLMSPLNTAFCLGVIALLYEQIERFGIQTFSPHFVYDTISILNFMAYVPVRKKSFVFFAAHRAYNAVWQIITMHRAVFRLGGIFWLACDVIGCGVMGTMISLSLKVVSVIVKSLLESSARFAFLVNLRMCLRHLKRSGFVRMISDIFFELIVLEGGLRIHRITTYVLLLAELFHASVDFANSFLNAPAYPMLIALLHDALETAPIGMLGSKPWFFQAIFYFETQLFRAVRSQELALPPLNHLFEAESRLTAAIAPMLCDCAIAIANRIGRFPYAVGRGMMDGLRSTDAEYEARALVSSEPERVEWTAPDTLPWVDWGVAGLAFLPHPPVAVVRRRERIPRSQVIIALETPPSKQKR
jgi:hypothetical protein